MKLILHAGPPKTGTIALQGALFAARHRLLELSVFYPGHKGRKGSNYTVLFEVFVPYEMAPRELKKHGPDKYTANSSRMREHIEQTISAHKPDCLVLSSEWFALARSAPDARRLIDYCRGLGATSIEILLYARKPSDLFLSASQQQLRASSHFRPVFGGTLRLRPSREWPAGPHAGPSDDIADVIEVSRARVQRLVSSPADSTWSPTRQSAAWLQSILRMYADRSPSTLPVWRQVLL